MISDRRVFLRATGSAFAALAASGCLRSGFAAAADGPGGYGPLLSDPNGLIDLPQGFSYRILSSLGDAMSDGGTVPDHADGMGCFDLGGGKWALVRNHELMPNHDSGGAVGPAFDTLGDTGVPLPGGTTTLVLNAETLAVDQQHRSLSGTIRNCAGGITPWGSWMTCEENVSRADGKINKDHGFVFEVPANAPGPIDPVPLKAMGRFNHEAACVDPATGVVYETEDREDGLLYRFIPNVKGKLAEGGKLQALAIDGLPDTRNWSGVTFEPQGWHGVRWIDLDNVEAPDDDLRKRGAAAGATIFARGEGIWMGEGELYFCCTSGGAAKLGQIFRLRPQASGPDRLQLFYESTSIEQFNFGDNLTVAPGGHLVVCEDQYTEQTSNHLRWITPEGVAYPLALSRIDTEWAGACFSPDGKVLFVNLYRPAKTVAITGPWIA
ncbi:alkaline phosphatase PhoX [Altererythrobacter sp. Root672]|uniref:alkaline phosphatase PhoX n=1 Tax=Altererythrobacter sp. Root672 TaxID=1736584 RepID=UPI0006F8E307|nr:alkaline phosphatase PhoX [Altererythrobacter sp. Root672]KRA80787.1 phosphatase [Altererythrobacter sp. Root672]